MQSGAHLQRASESHHGLLVFATQRVIVADHAARLGAIAIDANAPVRERRELNWACSIRPRSGWKLVWLEVGPAIFCV